MSARLLAEKLRRALRNETGTSFSADELRELGELGAVDLVIQGEAEELRQSGVPAAPSGYSAEPEPSFTVSAVPVSIPNAVLAVLIDRLPPFSGYWPMAHIDGWFEWFFALLDAAILAERTTNPRPMLAEDIGCPLWA